MNKMSLLLAGFLSLPCLPVDAKEVLRILTWEGYVTVEDVSKVNSLLTTQGYDTEIKVISPYAEGPQQMYELMRSGKVDISFLTLFFIKLQGEKSTKIVQPIDTTSPRLSNYKFLLPALTRIPMGMQGDKVLYIPFAGGSYGFYVNRKTVPAADVPHSWNDLFAPRWRGKYSLNKAQVWYNIAITSLALGKEPYYLNDLAESGRRSELIGETSEGSQLFNKLTALYSGAGDFWEAAPAFPQNLEIVSSWGIEINEANRKGGDWRIIEFKEGQLVWMDTINFARSLTGKRLEAAEIVANYFIGQEVQSRVASELSLVSVSSLAASNPILKKNPKFFTSGTFVPPYNVIADNLMTQMSNAALRNIGVTGH